MKRMSKALVASLLIAVSITGVALAASSPTVITGSATKITNTTAILQGRVNPNGKTTGYLFDYGSTVAYGAVTQARSAGHGRKGVDVNRTITGLTPGTVYHYRISALSGSGSATGGDRSFKTTGFPPAFVLTGPAVNVGTTVATPTGTIDPRGAPTNFVIQYGLTTKYGVQTFSLALSPVSGALPVAVQLFGLAPATLFHYRIVAYHGSVASPGLDATFFTEPRRRPKPDFTAHTSPGRATRSPYTFTTSGELRGAGFIPAAQRCAGSVAIRYSNGHRRLAFVVAPVGGDCKFTAQAAFRRTYGHGATRLRVSVAFSGNGYLAPRQRTNHVTAG